MTGIKITYSWGDEESLVHCSKEDAWKKMCELAGKEAFVASYEEEENIETTYNVNETEIVLHYCKDDEYCYYRFEEEI